MVSTETGEYLLIAELLDVILLRHFSHRFKYVFSGLLAVLPLFTPNGTFPAFNVFAVPVMHIKIHSVRQLGIF